MRMLFVCAANTNRSPTFETYFKKYYPKHEYRSAGCYFGYPYFVNEETLAWAEIIFVMDLSQHRFIKDKYPKHINKVHVIGVSDQYETESEGLKEIIRYWIDNFGWKHFV